MNKIMLLLSCAFIFGYTLCAHGRVPFTLTYAEEYEVNTLNPLKAENAAELRVASLIYNSLVTYDLKSQYTAELLENLNTESRGVNRSFNLRRDVKWYACLERRGDDRLVQEIKSFNAADVDYTFDQIKSDRNSRYHFIINWFKDVKIDTNRDNIVTFVLWDDLEDIQPSEIYKYLVFPIIPQPPCDSVPYRVIDCATFPETNGQPVIGTGPYVFSQCSDQYITLKRNSNYFLGWPHVDNRIHWPIDNIRVTCYTDPVRAKGDFITSGRVTLLINVPTQHYGEISNAYYASTKLHSVNNFTAFPFNCARPPFSDPGIREGFTYLLDRRGIFQNVYGTVYDLAEIEHYLVPCPLPSTLRDPQLRQQPHNDIEGQKLLDAAHYPRIRHTLKAFIIEGSDFNAICAQFIRHMGEHNIQIDMPSLTLPQWENALKDRDFGITFSQWFFEREKNIIAELFKTDTTGNLKGTSGNFVGYSNGELDELLRQYREGKMLLFSIELTFQSDLNNGNISERLRQEFVRNNIQFSQHVTISIIEQDRMWLITDQERKYAIESSEDDRLNIYDITEQLTMIYRIGNLIYKECPYIFLFSVPKIAAYRNDLLGNVLIDPDSFFEFINRWYASR